MIKFIWKQFYSSLFDLMLSDGKTSLEFFNRKREKQNSKLDFRSNRKTLHSTSLASKQFGASLQLKWS